MRASVLLRVSTTTVYVSTERSAKVFMYFHDDLPNSNVILYKAGKGDIRRFLKH